MWFQASQRSRDANTGVVGNRAMGGDPMSQRRDERRGRQSWGSRVLRPHVSTGPVSSLTSAGKQGCQRLVEPRAQPAWSTLTPCQGPKHPAPPGFPVPRYKIPLLARVTASACSSGRGLRCHTYRFSYLSRFRTMSHLATWAPNTENAVLCLERGKNLTGETNTWANETPASAAGWRGGCAGPAWPAQLRD